jgi:hypothetical protein
VSNTLAAANNVNVNALLHARTPATIDRAGHAGVAILSLLAEFLCYTILVNDNSRHNQLAKQFLTTKKSQIRLSGIVREGIDWFRNNIFKSHNVPQDMARLKQVLLSMWVHTGNPPSMHQSHESSPLQVWQVWYLSHAINKLINKTAL